MSFKLIKIKPTVSKKDVMTYSSLSVFFFFLFALFTLIVRTDKLRSFDFNTTVRLQDDIPLRFDPYFSYLSIGGRFEFTIIILALILLFRRQLWGIIVVGIFGFAHVVEIIGKTLLNQPGPPDMFLRSHYTDFPGLYVHTQASYPSGHSMRALILALLLTTLVWQVRKLPVVLRLGVVTLLFGIVFFMLLSRVSLGEHWTTDIVGGSLLGLSAGFLSLIFL